MNPFVKTVLHGLQVAATIAGSMLLTGASIYFSNPQNLAVFGNAFEHWGVPVAVVNIIVAMVVKYIKEHQKDVSAQQFLQDSTIDTVPNDQTPQV
jgi:hypothetical protein